MTSQQRILTVALAASLATAGCGGGTYKPSLSSTNPNERLQAVRAAAQTYGAQVAAAGSTPSGPGSAALPRLPDGALPIDGTWTIKAISQGKVLSEEPATLKNGQIRIPGAKDYWKNFRLLPDRRYAAVRVAPAAISIFPDIEAAVEFYVDSQGHLHQDDSQVSFLKRTVNDIVLAPVKLDNQQAFKAYHQTRQ